MPLPCAYVGQRNRPRSAFMPFGTLEFVSNCTRNGLIGCELQCVQLFAWLSWWQYLLIDQPMFSIFKNWKFSPMKIASDNVIVMCICALAEVYFQLFTLVNNDFCFDRSVCTLGVCMCVQLCVHARVHESPVTAYRR